MKTASSRPARLAIAGAALAVFCAGATARCSRRAHDPVLLLVTVDTLRADHLGCYGHSSAATPVIDKLASEGTLFEDASTVTPLTLPAHASILTGRAPGATGVRNNGMFVLPERETTLAEALKARGFGTGAFVGSFVVSAPFGLSQGFDVYDESFDMKREGPTSDERRAATVNAAVFKWLESAPRGALFLWVHYFDPHAKYEPPAPFDSQFAASPYDGEIASVDRAIGELVQKLRERSGGKNFSIILVADHGEGLGEHGEATHGLFVYQSTLHVPLIIWGPGRVPPGVRVSEPVSVVDVFDTALDLAGVSGTQRLPRQGVDLLPLARGKKIPRPLPVAFESWLSRLEFGWSEISGMREGSLKLIDAPRPELFDLASDSSEIHDLAARRPDEVSRLRTGLEKSLAVQTSSLKANEPKGMDQQTLERLRGLGYVSAGAPLSGTSSGSSPALADPKDRLEIYNRLKAAGDAVNQGGQGLSFALSTLEQVLREDPSSVAAQWRYSEALLMAGRPAEVIRNLRPHLNGAAEYFWVPWLLGKAHVALGQRETALVMFREAGRRSPFFERRGVDVPALLRQMGRLEESLAEARRGIERTPRDPALLELAADDCRDLGRTQEALDLYRRTLEISPGQTSAGVSAATLLIDAGEAAEAVKLLTNLLAVSPDNPQASRLLGLALMNEGKLQQALEALSRAESLQPSQPETLYYLGLCFVEMERLTDAERVIDDLVTRAPDSAHSYRALGRLREKQGRRADAVQAYRHALVLDPSDREAARALKSLSGT